MISPHELLKITIDNIPQEVKNELDNIEKELIKSAKCGKRAYTHPVKNYQHREMLLKTISEYGYKVTLKLGGDTRLEIWW